MKHTTQESTDLAFIMRPEKWPLWPVLPLKKGWETAFVMENLVEGTLIVYMGNIHEIAKATLTDKTPEQMIREGWRVD